MLYIDVYLTSVLRSDVGGSNGTARFADVRERDCELWCLTL
jgi:hypothetical protein